MTEYANGGTVSESYIRPAEEGSICPIPRAMTDNRTTERVDHPPRVREAIDELMREKDATDNRTIELDSCEVVRLDGVEVQQNGIIRDNRGWIIGRADTEWMRYTWRMLVSGICPCCGREVEGGDD